MIALDELERVAERVAPWRVERIAFVDGSVRLVEGDGPGRWRVVSLPTDVANAIVSLPELAAELRRLRARVDQLERWAAVAIGCLDERVKEAGNGE